MGVQRAIARLPLYGPAGLYVDGGRVAMRAKSLAILYYLALEGPTRRATLASLLWPHGSARQNLRVELHELRSRLRRIGLVAFGPGADPLVLPAGVALDPAPSGGGFLEGLEAVSEGFRGWLEAKRAGRDPAGGGLEVEGYGQAWELAQEVVPPFLLIVKGSPTASLRSFAARLAREMDLPLIEGGQGGGLAVRYLPYPQSDAQVREVLAGPRSVWVLATAPFGEDHRPLLELRARWPADRARYLVLRPLPWPEAAAGPLAGLPFAQAAAFYLCSGGEATHLRYLLEAARAGSRAPSLPQQVRAAYQRETRYLSQPARLALERLSVHPGELSQGLVGALGASEHLDELERRGWLRYHGAWSFASEPARRVLYRSLQPGRRARYHGVAADHFAGRAPVAHHFHAMAAGREPGRPPTPEGLPEWARLVWRHERGLEAGFVEPRTRGPSPRNEVFYGPPEVRGAGWGVQQNRFYFVQNGPPFEKSELVFPAAEEPVMLHLEGRGYEENVLGVGLDGARLPLALEAGGKTLARFAPVARELAREDGAVLPLRAFDLWAFVPPGRGFRLIGAAERAVIEFRLKVFRGRTADLHRPRLVRFTA